MSSACSLLTMLSSCRSQYEVSDDTDSVQMLQRSTQIGEFYRMAAPKVFNTSEKLPPHYMDIIIYDEEMDKHVHITIREALKFAMVGAAKTDNLYKDVKAGEKTDAGEDVAKGLTASYNPKDAAGNAIANPVLDSLPSATAAELAALVATGVWMPLEVIIARPFIEHLMMSAIMAVSGRDTGATLFGPADMQISANTSVKTIEGHYTCHTKSVITKPQNVLVLRDIMCSGYVAGGNTKFFGDGYAKKKKTDPTTDDITQSITNRLSFVDDASGEYESMLAFIVPYGHGDRRDQVYSLSARLLPWEVTRAQGDWYDYFPGGSESFKYYKDKYQLEQVHFGEDIRAAENMEFISQGSVNNALCFVGPHRCFSSWSQTFYELNPGQGHFGPDALPGDARWRRGEAVSLDGARNSMVSLEAAAHSQMVFQKRN